MKTETVLNKNIQRNRLIAASISEISGCCHFDLICNVRLLLGFLIMAIQMSHLVEDVRYVLLWA